LITCDRGDGTKFPMEGWPYPILQRSSVRQLLDSSILMLHGHGTRGQLELGGKEFGSQGK